MRSLSGIKGTGPTDVATATGIELQLVTFIKNAWIDIQAHPKQWKWMWGDYKPVGGNPLQTVATAFDYVLVNVDTILVKTFRSYLTATGISDRQRMTYSDFEKFQNSFGIVVADDARPIRATRLPTGDLRLYPTPDDIYSIEFEYFKTPQILAVNADVPDMPARFHQLIVYEALKRFGKAHDAPEIERFGETEAGSEGSEGNPSSGLWRALIWDQEIRRTANQNENEFMVVIPQ
ncbi:MAG: hypothetical protein V3R76_00295 [Gammaproteobacteria bacterium]